MHQHTFVFTGQISVLRRTKWIKSYAYKVGMWLDGEGETMRKCCSKVFLGLVPQMEEYAAPRRSVIYHHVPPSESMMPQRENLKNRLLCRAGHVWDYYLFRMLIKLIVVIELVFFFIS